MGSKTNLYHEIMSRNRVIRVSYGMVTEKLFLNISQNRGIEKNCVDKMI